jgi:hypothetical protein
MLLPLMVRETVAVDTLARLATSVMFIRGREHGERHIIPKEEGTLHKSYRLDEWRVVINLGPHSWPADAMRFSFTQTELS